MHSLHTLTCLSWMTRKYSAPLKVSNLTEYGNDRTSSLNLTFKYLVPSAMSVPGHIRLFIADIGFTPHSSSFSTIILSFKYTGRLIKETTNSLFMMSLACTTAPFTLIPSINLDLPISSLIEISNLRSPFTLHPMTPPQTFFTSLSTSIIDMTSFPSTSTSTVNSSPYISLTTPRDSPLPLLSSRVCALPSSLFVPFSFTVCLSVSIGLSIPLSMIIVVISVSISVGIISVLNIHLNLDTRN